MDGSLQRWAYGAKPVLAVKDGGLLFWCERR
ncbi:hypothetical protein V6Z11_D05G416600 [Gossypium hirsutum]